MNLKYSIILKCWVFKEKKRSSGLPTPHFHWWKLSWWIYFKIGMPHAMDGGEIWMFGEADWLMKQCLFYKDPAKYPVVKSLNCLPYYPSPTPNSSSNHAMLSWWRHLVSVSGTVLQDSFFLCCGVRSLSSWVKRVLVLSYVSMSSFLLDSISFVPLFSVPFL